MKKAFILFALCAFSSFSVVGQTQPQTQDKGLNGADKVLDRIQLPAEEEGGWSFGVGADLMSSYLWRGLQLNDGFSVMPNIYLDYEKGNFSFEANAYYERELFKYKKTFDDLYHEGGVGLVFGYGAFTLSFNDYFDFSDGWGHAIEAGLGYTVSEKFPLCLEWYSFLWMPGYETKWDSYAQVSYPLEVGDFTFTFAAGVMPFNTDYYGNYTGFNLSLLGATAEYTFDLGRGFSLPLKGELLYNNIDKKPYGALTVSFYFDK